MVGGGRAATDQEKDALESVGGNKQSLGVYFLRVLTRLGRDATGFH